MDKELLKSMLEQKLVLVQKHPDTDLFIYNYSPLVQYQKLWNEITLMTRGLILDKEMNIVARPFKKFFNLEIKHSLMYSYEIIALYFKKNIIIQYVKIQY